MEKKPVLIVVLILFACGFSIFYPYYRESFEGFPRLCIYVLGFIFLGVSTVLLFRRGETCLSSFVFFDILFVFYPYLEWQKRALPLTFSGILYLVPVMVYLVLALSIKRIRKSVTWLRSGHIDGGSLLIIAAVVVLSALGLVGWVLLAKHDVGIFLDMMPDLPFMLMVMGSLGFALSNAFVEELIFRGVLWQVLTGFFQRDLVALLLQALLFGLWHWKGFPGGPSGMVLVFVWGVILGWVRRRSGGMLGPFICHVCADLAIFWILYAILLRGNW
jgi:membrane protease YdiL (CAAX protease family)